MAGELILVVEDSPVGIKFLATVLRANGYRVSLASNAEQALGTLRTVRPDLIIVDLHLPGIDGLALTRDLRSNPRTSETPIIAYTAASDPESREQALAAGCNRFLIKPVQVDELVEHLRELLGDKTAPDKPADPPISTAASSTPSLFGPEVDVLRRRFLSSAIRDAKRMQGSVESDFDVAEGTRLLHQWIGSAGVLGYPDIAEQARRTEQLLAGSKWSRAELRAALNELVRLVSAPYSAEDVPIPQAIREQVEGTRVGLFGFEGEVADRVCGALADLGATPYILGRDERPESLPQYGCGVALVRVGTENSDSSWLRPESEYPPLPILFVGAKEDVLRLDTEVQRRAAEILMDPWEPEELMMRLSLAISRSKAGLQSESPAPSVNASGPDQGDRRLEVLIADDDPNVTAVVERVLVERGFRVHTVSSGSEALRTLQVIVPDAAVLDVNMPGMNGFEVLAAIRQERIPTKIIMLTAQQREQDILRGFQLGADDYVAKPFLPLELVARLKRLI